MTPSRPLVWANEAARFLLIALTPVGVLRGWPMHFISPGLLVAIALIRRRTWDTGPLLTRAMVWTIAAGSVLLGVCLYFAERWLRPS